MKTGTNLNRSGVDSGETGTVGLRVEQGEENCPLEQSSFLEYEGGLGLARFADRVRRLDPTADVALGPREIEQGNFAFCCHAGNHMVHVVDGSNQTRNCL